MFFKLSQILQDSNSEFSSMRSVMLLWCVGVLLMWAYICFKKLTLLEIPESVVATIAVVVTGKYFQKRVETKNTTCPPNTNTDTSATSGLNKN